MRVVPVPLAVAAALLCCASAVAFSGDPTLQRDARDQRTAAGLVVHQGDLPRTWRTVGAEPESAGVRFSLYLCPRLQSEHDLELTGSASSAFGPPSALTSTAGDSVAAVWRSDHDAAADFERATSPAFARCLPSVITRALAARHTHGQVIADGPITIPRLATRTRAFEVSARYGGGKMLTYDFVFVGAKRANALIAVAGGTRADVTALARAVAGRLAR